jgi:Protein of unknown function DUF262
MLIPLEHSENMAKQLQQHELQDEGATGFEAEDTSGEVEIEEPFDPSLIRVESRSLTVSLLLTRIMQDEINLQPDFQRKAGIWTLPAQSRLIESLLIRIPLPAFYMDGTDDDDWLVVDGLQRLTALRNFILEESFALEGLEFLSTFSGKRFSQLPRSFQRRIEETQVTVFVIQEKTPPQVKFNIFKRINTGGLPLSPQEIRHALYPGPAAVLLKQLAQSPDFRNATSYGIRDDRMGDRECVLRGLAFMLLKPDTYRAGELDSFLNRAMVEINGLKESEISVLRERFLKALRVARAIFGKHTFRKVFEHQTSRSPLNKAIFEIWVVALSSLSDREADEAIARKSVIKTKFSHLLEYDPRFNAAVSIGTGDSKKVRYRFSKVAALLREALNA